MRWKCRGSGVEVAAILVLALLVVSGPAVPARGSARESVPARQEKADRRADSPKPKAESQATGPNALDPKLKQEVEQLLRQLDAPELRNRDGAQKQLEQHGPEILPLLPDPSLRQSAEVQRRVGEVRQALYRQKAAQTGKPSQVTLQGKGMPLKEVLAALSEQTGNAVADYRAELGQPVGEEKLDLDFRQTPFWEAMDEVVRQSGLRYYLDSQKGGIGLVGQGVGLAGARAQYAGPLRVTPTDLDLHKDLRGLYPATCTLTMDVMWEPRLRPLYLKQAMADFQATDEAGKPVPATDTEASYEMTPALQRPATQLAIAFQAPPRSSQKIARLHGKLLLGVPTQIETFRFAKPAESKNKPIRRSGLTVTLEGFRSDEFRWHAHVKLSYEESAGEAFESYRAGWLTHNEIYLEDAKGERFPFNGGMRLRGFGKGTADIEYIFVDVPEKIESYTLVYRSPGMILELPIEFDLADLALP